VIDTVAASFFVGVGVGLVSLVPAGLMLLSAWRFGLRFCVSVLKENQDLKTTAANWSVRVQVLENAMQKEDTGSDDDDDDENQYRGG